MKKVIVGRFGEIHLKGENRGFFLRALERNIKIAVGGAATVNLEQGRVILSDFKNDTQIIAEKTANVFGIVSVSIASCLTDCGPDKILDYMKTLKIQGTFKVEVNRADKKFPIKSTDFAAECGEVLLSVNDVASVNVHNPTTTVFVDIREQRLVFVYDRVIKGVGGMPVGTAGRALVMLSGGIDSPVAAYLAAKRGLSVDCVHFASPPYTSDFALDKVKRLVKQLGVYCGTVRFFVVPFTEIQEQIKTHCNGEYMITIMRRFMVRIAEKLAEGIAEADCIITGECLAQVASQTVKGIASNNCCAVSRPILRPLVTYDKSEIIELAKKIGTYDISIEPHADCCTVFVPRHPMIHPSIKKCEEQEKTLDVEGLVSRACKEFI